MITILMMILTAGITYYYTKRHYLDENQIDIEIYQDKLSTYRNTHNKLKDEFESLKVQLIAHEVLAEMYEESIQETLYYDVRTDSMFSLADEEIVSIGEL